jgi:DUF1009 family protein
MTTPTRSETAPRLKLGPRDRVGIVAGNGRLPLNLAQSLAASGHEPYVFMVEGEADGNSAMSSFPNERLTIGEFADLARILKARKITHVVLAGGITRRPPWKEIPITMALLMALPKVIAALARGDDGLLRILVGAIEKHGIRVVGPHELVPDLLAIPGPMTRASPLAGDRRDLDAALAAARAIGALDIGQGAVSIGGRVVALEGIEGTDGMLERVKALRGHGRLAGRQRGVLVKCAKPGQELRADMPAVGPDTVAAAHAAGLAGIGLEAGRTLVMDFAEMVERADALGLFVVGLAEAGPP